VNAIFFIEFSFSKLVPYDLSLYKTSPRQARSNSILRSCS
jgi:hypothetical protein